MLKGFSAVDGVVRGTGTGTSKQAAKEEASRQAFYGMGWHEVDYEAPCTLPAYYDFF